MRQLRFGGPHEEALNEGTRLRTFPGLSVCPLSGLVLLSKSDRPLVGYLIAARLNPVR